MPHTFAKHPYAAAQATEQGRIIQALHVHAGRLYAGYGDWQANTGPIVVASVDLADFAAGWADHHTTETESVHSYRTLAGQLYAPAVDRRGDGADYSSDTGGWADHQPVGTDHLFDMAATVDGLWMVGSLGNDAIVWRSTDGGTSWSPSLTVTPVGDDNYLRFYMAATIGDTLHVQAVRGDNGHHPTSRVWDGATWGTGPDLCGIDAQAHWPLEWGTGFLFRHNWYANDPLWYFDDSTVTEVRGCWDYTTDGSTVWVLDGDVYASTDLTTWDKVARGTDALGRSLAVADGFAYIGRTDSIVERKLLSEVALTDAVSQRPAPGRRLLITA